jgi:hypothetical protein
VRDDIDLDNDAAITRTHCLALNPESRNVPMTCREKDGHAGDHRHLAYGEPKSEAITWPNEDQAA